MRKLITEPSRNLLVSKTGYPVMKFNRIFNVMSDIEVFVVADGSEPTEDAFPTNDDEIPDDFDTKTDFKRDASISLGNVAKSYSSPLHRVQMSVSKATSSSERRDDDAFLFMCASTKNPKILDRFCETPRTWASTNDGLDRMVLCPVFFAKVMEQSDGKITNVNYHKA